MAAIVVYAYCDRTENCAARYWPDRGRLGHTHRAVEQGGHRAERVNVKKRPCQRTGREGQHFQLVRYADLLERPKRPERAGAHAVIQGDHGSGLYMSSFVRSYSCTQLAVLSGASFVASRHRLV